MDTTMIQIKKDTQEELKKIRIVERESYDEVIKRLLNKTVTKDAPDFNELFKEAKKYKCNLTPQQLSKMEEKVYE